MEKIKALSLYDYIDACFTNDAFTNDTFQRMLWLYVRNWDYMFVKHSIPFDFQMLLYSLLSITLHVLTITFRASYVEL